MVKEGNEVSNCFFFIKSGVEQGCFPSLSTWIILMDFALRSTAKAMREYRIEWRSENHLHFDYADGLSISD